MKTFLLTVTTAAAVLTSAPLLTGTATAASRQLAQVDVQIAPPAVRIEEDRRPGVVIEERRRVAPGVVIEGTDHNDEELMWGPRVVGAIARFLQGPL